MINKAMWEKNRYAQHAKVEITDEYEMVTFPMSVSDDEHVSEAARFLAEQGIHEKPGREAKYHADLNQVLRDVRVIDFVSVNGSDICVQTDIEHWAYFDRRTDLLKFYKALFSKGYEIRNCYANEDNQAVIKFAHTGNLELSDISLRTIWLSRQARKLRGEYDGWEVTTDREGNLKAVQH